MSSDVSFGEPSFNPSPYSELSYPEDSEIFAAKIRQFSQAVLSAEAWFRVADELIATINLIEPNVERYWEDVRSLASISDEKSDTRSKQQNSDVLSKHDLVNQHMMLAGFQLKIYARGIWRSS